MKTKTTRKPERTAGPYSKCRAMVPLDTDRIRKSELGKLHRQKATCAKLDAELERFEKEEMQAHRQWIQTHCGPAITKYRTLQAESSLLGNMLELAYDLIDFYPNRSRQACANAAVSYFETNGQIPEGFEVFFSPASERPASGANPFGPDDEDYEDDGFMDAFEEEFQAFIEEMLNEGKPGQTRKHVPRSQHRREEKAIKELYRRIARRLHPDGAGGTTPAQLELWHAAQKAYENHDRETLERIDARCDLLDSEDTKTAPVSSIQKGIAYYKNACTRLRYAIRRAKLEPEWGFLGWSEKKKQRLLEEYQREIECEIQYASRLRNQCKEQLENMRRPPAASKRSASQKKSPPRKAGPAPPSDDQSSFDFL